MFTDSVSDRLTALQDFLSHARIRLKDEKRMRECMVPDQVAAFSDLCRNFRPLAHVPSDKKKRCENVVLSQNIEQIQRVRIIWPIVKGERDLLRSTRQSVKRSPEPLAGGRHRLISGNSCSYCSGNSNAKHAGIVNAADELPDLRIDGLPEIRQSINPSIRKSADGVNFFLNCAHAALGIFSKAISLRTQHSWPSFSNYPGTSQ
jgi:hypothetical protein